MLTENRTALSFSIAAKNEKIGGFSKTPGVPPIILHSFYSIAWLSLDGCEHLKDHPPTILMSYGESACSEISASPGSHSTVASTSGPHSDHFDVLRGICVYLEGWVCEKSKHKITQPVSSRHLLRRKRATGTH